MLTLRKGLRILNRLYGFLLGIGVHTAYGGYFVAALVEVDDADALRSAAHHTEISHADTESDARLVYNHEVVVIVDALNGYDVAGLFGNVHRLDTLAAAVCDTVAVEQRALAETILGDNHHILVVVGVHADHAYNLVGAVVVETHTTHAGADATHLTYGRLVEADGTAVAVGHEDFGIAVGKLYAYYLIALTDYNGFLALDVDAGIFSQ